jgi:hypothetical protein
MMCVGDILRMKKDTPAAAEFLCMCGADFRVGARDRPGIMKPLVRIERPSKRSSGPTDRYELRTDQLEKLRENL